MVRHYKIALEHHKTTFYTRRSANQMEYFIEFDELVQLNNYRQDLVFKKFP